MGAQSPLGLAARRDPQFVAKAKRRRYVVAAVPMQRFNSAVFPVRYWVLYNWRCLRLHQTADGSMLPAMLTIERSAANTSPSASKDPNTTSLNHARCLGSTIHCKPAMVPALLTGLGVQTEQGQGRHSQTLPATARSGGRRDLEAHNTRPIGSAYVVPLLSLGGLPSLGLPPATTTSRGRALCGSGGHNTFRATQAQERGGKKSSSLCRGTRVVDAN